MQVLTKSQIDYKINKGKVMEKEIANIVSNEKKCFERNSYGFYNRIRDLVNEKIKELVLSKYEVTIKEKG